MMVSSTASRNRFNSLCSNHPLLLLFTTLVIVVCHPNTIVNVSAFTLSNIRPPSSSCSFISTRTPTNHDSPTRHFMSPPSSSYSSHYNDKTTTFILSFDGTVSDTARSRARLAIDVALETWPFLQYELSFVCSPNDDFNNDDEIEKCFDATWLINKMEALAHVTTEGVDKDYDDTNMLCCDDVLLARMLIEEQMLDGGRSSGSGKYGSKYHPTGRGRRSRNKRGGNGSRPLTVGEISANWVDGGCLRDTARVKYNVEGKDPFPVIQENLLRLQSSQPAPKVRPFIIDALTTSISRRREQQKHSSPSNKEPQNPIVYILVNHESQKSAAYTSLSSILPPSTRIHIAEQDDYDTEENYDVIITSPDQTEKTTRTTWDVIQNIVQYDLEPYSTVYVVHSSLYTLRQSRYLFGDDSPRFINGLGKSVFGNKVQLSLLLPTWADNVVHSQHISATMDPWMNVLKEEELCELITARIVSS